MEAVAAPALAGLLIAWLGVKWVFWFDAFTYLVSALLVASVAIPRLAKARVPLAWRTFLSEISYGTRVLLREPSLRQALLLSAAEATAGAAAIVATIVYLHDVLHQGTTTFALVMAALGMGSTLGAILLGRLTGRYEFGMPDPAVLHGRRHRWAARALIGGGVLLGVVLLPGVLQPPLVVFGLLWLLNGTGQALIAISSSTLLAEHTFAEDRGRAYAAHFALTHACWLLAYPAIGHAAASLGTPLTFTLAGGVCLAITGIAHRLGPGQQQPHRHERRHEVENI